jgi:hypothetical protein
MFPLQSLPLPIRLLIYYTILYTRSIPLTTLLVLSRESHSFVRAEVYRRVSLTSLRQLEAFGRSDGVKRDGRMVRVLRCDVVVVDKYWGNRMLICTNRRRTQGPFGRRIDHSWHIAVTWESDRVDPKLG